MTHEVFRVETIGERIDIYTLCLKCGLEDEHNYHADAGVDVEIGLRSKSRASAAATPSASPSVTATITRGGGHVSARSARNRGRSSDGSSLTGSSTGSNWSWRITAQNHPKRPVRHSEFSTPKRRQREEG